MCGLSSNIYNDRLRYAISELFDISSSNITGFTLKDTKKSIETVWSSISINGQNLIYEEKDSETIEEHDVNQSMSNTAFQTDHPAIQQSIMRENETEKMRR